MASLPATVLGAGTALWIVATFALGPFALAERVRALLERGPTGMPAMNYVLATFALAIGHVTAMIAVTMAFGPFRDLEILWWITVVNVGYPLTVVTVGTTILSRRGRWSPTGGGLDGRLVLGVAAAWYALVTTIVAGFVLLTAALFAFPGGY